MKLIDFDGLEFKVADEVLLIRQFRELFRADKSKKKDEFWKQISYLWFMCDPRSTYQYITDDSERAKEIIAQEGLGSGWKPSSLLLAAMDIYKKHTTTTASLLLDDMRRSIEDLRYTLRMLGESVRGGDDADEEGSRKVSMPLDKALNAMTKTIKEIPEMARALVEAEKALEKDFAQDDKARGTSEKAIGEDL